MSLSAPAAPAARCAVAAPPPGPPSLRYARTTTSTGPTLSGSSPRSPAAAGGASNSATSASPVTTPGSSTGPPPSTCATSSAAAWTTATAPGCSPNQHPAGTRPACRHPAKPAWLAIGGKSDHVAGPQGLAYCRTDGLVGALPAPRPPLFSGLLARPGGPVGGSDGLAPERDRPSPPQRLLLVVDQFEELFTQCAEEGQRRAFITALHAAATAGHVPDRASAALVVLGVRADFEARSADYAELADAVQDRYLVTAMTGRQLRMAITEPAKKADSGVDDDLVEALLAEVSGRQPGTSGAGMLPLLSHALDQAWRSRAGQNLTLADYERTGGIDGAVAASAQRAYDGLTVGQQAAARQVFTRLTATSSEGVDSADRASKAELTEGRSPAGAQDVEQVLEAFAAERLLTFAAGTVEISHEALLTAWPLLRDSWLADTHADRIVRTRLHATAAEWERHARDRSYLYTGTLLATATDTAARIGADPARHPPFSQTERDFLHASSHAHRRTVRRRQGLIALLMALVIGLASVA